LNELAAFIFKVIEMSSREVPMFQVNLLPPSKLED
jgi:hypothetical protein